ncbi:MAG: response regulator transcription factor [Actinomycetes bacterium]
MTISSATDMLALTRKSLRVVVADNDASVIELVTTDLALEGHNIVATALTGEQAVVLCRQHRPDVLIVDFRMPPGLNGLETIRRVLAEKTVATCILYTNYRAPHIAADARRLGATYVRKGPLRTLRAALRTD